MPGIYSRPVALKNTPLITNFKYSDYSPFLVCFNCSSLLPPPPKSGNSVSSLDLGHREITALREQFPLLFEEWSCNKITVWIITINFLWIDFPSMLLRPCLIVCSALSASAGSVVWSRCCEYTHLTINNKTFHNYNYVNYYVMF